MLYVVEHCHIITHPKFLAAGVHGRDLWEWGMKWSGLHETDGEIPMVAVLASTHGYGGQRNIKAAEKLVEVGLWERTDAGFRSLKWTEMGNKTKAQLEAAREKERAKKKAQRGSDPPGLPLGTPQGNPTGTPEGVLNSTSYSSGSGSSGESPERGPPPWFVEVVTAVCDDTGEKFAAPEAWLRYSGHRATKGIAVNAQDARYWLGTVMVPEARKERRAESDRRLNQQRRDGPPERPKQSREEARREAQEFAAHLAARNKGAA